MTTPATTATDADLVTSGTVGLADLASKMLAPLDAATPPDTLPAFPATRALPDKVATALRRLPNLLGMTAPAKGERRQLTDRELAQITAEREVIDEALTVLEARKKTISEIVRVHQDCRAEGEGRVAERDSKGHLILAAPEQPYRVPVLNSGKAWSQEYVQGGISYASEDELAQLQAEGTLSRDDYLGITRELRVFDTTKAAGYFRKHPGRTGAIVRAIATRGRPRTSLYLRNQKGS